MTLPKKENSKQEFREETLKRFRELLEAQRNLLELMKRDPVPVSQGGHHPRSTPVARVEGTDAIL